MKHKITPLARERARAARLRAWLLQEIGHAYGARITDAENNIETIGRECARAHRDTAESVKRIESLPANVATVRLGVIEGRIADAKRLEEGARLQMYGDLKAIRARLDALEATASAGPSPKRLAEMIAKLGGV